MSTYRFLLACLLACYLHYIFSATIVGLHQTNTPETRQNGDTPAKHTHTHTHIPCGFLEHPSLPKFLPLAQTYCKTRGHHQNMVSVHFFLLRAVFPKSGWSVLQDNRSLKCSKGASRNRSAKRAQISATRAQISAKECKKNT